MSSDCLEGPPDDCFTTHWCSGCRCELKEPYIRCAECSDPICTICLTCFAKGFESERHQNDHAFELLRNDFCLWDDTKWNAGEELKLLEAIDDNGLGNWGAIARCINDKTPRDCENHFWQFYLKMMDSSNSGRSALTNGIGNMEECCPIPYKVSENPPRPQVDSVRYGDMAGYSASRGDFVTEYDNYAESYIKDIEFSQYENEIEEELKLAMVKLYNDRLRERVWRKKIMADCGLIDVWRLSLTWQQFEDDIGKAGVKSLCAVMRLVDSEEFLMLLEMFKYEMQLQEKIKRLQEFRQMGLTKLTSIKLYTKLKRKRDENLTKRRIFDTLLQVGFSLKANRNNSQSTEEPAKINSTAPFPTPSRRVAPPMDVTGLPGYNKLNENERELCSTVRLVPDAYLDYKNILLSENYRNGFLRLAQARQLIKIDVNKTRKIYDFLVKEGLITTNAPVNT
ncbi:hypothetical protein CHUAL_001447 [Chamberlinius hualienensis]